MSKLTGADYIKTITISFQLRVPRKMSVADVRGFIKAAIHTEAELSNQFVMLYRKRVEIFAP